MSRFQDLNHLFNRRLLTAVIRDTREQGTTSRYDEELQRQRKLQDVILIPEIKLHRADVQLLMLKQEELPPEQQDWTPCPDQEDHESPLIKEEQEAHEPPLIKVEQEDHESPLIKEEQEVHESPLIKEEQEVYESPLIKEDQEVHESPLIKEEQELHVSPLIKEEQEELFVSQGGVQFQGLEEADTRFLLTLVHMRSENDEEGPQSSLLHQGLTDHMETAAGEEDCGRPEPAKSSDPQRNSPPEIEVDMEASSDIVAGTGDGVADRMETGACRDRLAESQFPPKMQSPIKVAAALALLIFFRLSASRRRQLRRRRFLRNLRLLAHKLTVEGPAVYCILNSKVPILRLWSNVELELKQDFRMTRRAMNGLHRLLHREQCHGWGNEMEILIYTYWLAHGLSYRVVSTVFNVPKATVHRIVHRVAKNILAKLNKVISFPPADKLEAVGEGFVNLSGTPAFANVVGAIDGNLFRIRPPPLQRPDYLSYKGFYSISMQAICDAKGKFFDIFVGCPGSVHDTKVMKNSPFYRSQRFPPPDYILLGDGGYPCLQTPVCLITPYKEPVNGKVQRQFNVHHDRARSIIERAFGMMKTRWRSTLFRALEVESAFAPQVIASCAFLHNVCMDNGDILDPDEDLAGDGYDPHPSCEAAALNETSGNSARDRLAALISEGVCSA